MKIGASSERKVTLILKRNNDSKVWYSLGKIIDKVGEQTKRTLKNAELIEKGKY